MSRWMAKKLCCTVLLMFSRLFWWLHWYGSRLQCPERIMPKKCWCNFSGPTLLGRFFICWAHAGHLLKTKDGFRFLNWEQVSFGDPSYTLAVFLASVQSILKFSRILEWMVGAYLKENNVPEFKKLVWQRLKEREVSNMIWRTWVKTQKIKW